MNQQRITGWLREFGSEYAVPNEVQALVDSGVIEDTSWHNDACPTFEAYNEHGYRLRMGVDCPDAEQREFPDAARFNVWLYDEDDNEEYPYSGDNLQDALLAILKTLGNLALRFEDDATDPDPDYTAINKFGNIAEQLMSSASAEKWNRYCLKATTAEIVSSAINFIKEGN